MMCHGFVRSRIFVLLCLETVSFEIISNTDGYVFISGKSQTALPLCTTIVFVGRRSLKNEA